MSRKQRHQRAERLLLPPSPPPRNPFASAPKMRRGVEVHEKSRGAVRRAENVALRRWLSGHGDPDAEENAEEDEAAPGALSRAARDR